MPTSFSASGTITEASTPTNPKSNGPSSLNARQPPSYAVPMGTLGSGHTIDSSSGVRVTEKNKAAVAQAGISAPGSRRHTARRSASMESRSEASGALSVAARSLLNVSGWPGPGATDVGDEVGDLLGGGVVRRGGEHRVLAGYGAHDLQALHSIEDAGDGPGGPVASADDHQVLGRGETEDEARQDLDAGGARLVRQRQVAAADLQHAELGEVPAHGRLRDFYALLREGRDHVLLGAELPFGDEPEDEILPHRLVHRCARRCQNASYLRCSSPRSSGYPSARFMFCTAAPDAPLSRLSTAANSRARLVLATCAMCGGSCRASTKLHPS